MLQVGLPPRPRHKQRIFALNQLHLFPSAFVRFGTLLFVSSASLNDRKLGLIELLADEATHSFILEEFSEPTQKQFVELNRVHGFGLSPFKKG